MPNKNCLSTRVFLSFVLIATASGVITLYTLYQLLLPQPEPQLWFFLILEMFLLAVLICSYIFIISAYYRIRKRYRKFIIGQIHEDFFLCETPELIPESEAVRKRLHYLLDKQNSIDISRKQSEFLALQNQINPHFLYNTLDAIRGDALISGNNNIAEITEALSSFFRYTITDIADLTTLEGELTNAENYFRIQQYRFDSKLHMNIHLPEDQEDVLDLQLPKLTFQPIIENAIFHGLETQTGDGYITLHIETTEKFLFIDITDTGIGISSDVLERINNSLEKAAATYNPDKTSLHSGIALKNVSRRIKLLFGDEYGVHLYSTPGLGTNAKITLPKIRK